MDSAQVGRMTAGAALGIRDTANAKKINSRRCPHSKDEKTASVTRKHKFLGRYQGDLRVEKFICGSTPPVRVKRLEERRYKKLQRPGVAWPAHQPRRCPEEMNVRKPIVA